MRSPLRRDLGEVIEGRPHWIRLEPELKTFQMRRNASNKSQINLERVDIGAMIVESSALKSSSATVIDFSCDRKTVTQRNSRSMHDLLYGSRPVSLTASEISAATGSSTSKRFRWIHCPSNNITWCQRLLEKYFLERDDADAGVSKAFKSSFNHQHRGSRLHAHYMRPMCQAVAQTHLDEEDEEAPDDEDQRAHSPVTLHPVVEAPVNDAHATRQDGSSGRRIHDHESATTTLYPEEADNGSDAGLETEPPRQRSAGGKMFMFAPYLHYETNDRRKKMQDAIRTARSRKTTGAQSTVADQQMLADNTDRDQKLIFAHVDPFSCTMNARRTLDQYYYRTIDTAKYRDHDQVVHRYQRNNLAHGESAEDIRLLMVDQLWMWIVAEDVIITAFPERWQQPTNDPHNVLETIAGDVCSQSRVPVSSVYELALVIATRCFGAFDRHNVSFGERLFLDMFDSSVGDAMDRETELFRAFKDASKEASRWLKVLTSPGKADYMYEMRVRAPKLDKDQPPGKSPRQKIPGPTPTLVRTLLDIGEETRLMREIKDIRDELNMLSMIFREQRKLLASLHKTLLATVEEHGGSKKVARNLNRLYDDALPDIIHPLQDIKTMDTQAERIYNSIRDLLDLKQNYAISMQAADTARQGRTLMVFTVVTVIFLPLSFLTAFFALDIRDFPHGPDGSQDMPLGFVAKYVFGIGFVVALLSVLLALAWERLGLYIRRGRRKVWFFLHEKKHHQGSHGKDERNIGVGRIETWQSGLSDATGRSSIDQPPAAQQRMASTDVERGDG